MGAGLPPLLAACRSGSGIRPELSMAEMLARRDGATRKRRAGMARVQEEEASRATWPELVGERRAGAVRGRTSLVQAAWTGAPVGDAAVAGVGSRAAAVEGDVGVAGATVAVAVAVGEDGVMGEVSLGGADGDGGGWGEKAVGRVAAAAMAPCVGSDAVGSDTVGAGPVGVDPEDSVAVDSDTVGVDPVGGCSVGGVTGRLG